MKKVQKNYTSYKINYLTKGIRGERNDILYFKYPKIKNIQGGKTAVLYNGNGILRTYMIKNYNKGGSINHDEIINETIAGLFFNFFEKEIAKGLYPKLTNEIDIYGSLPCRVIEFSNGNLVDRVCVSDKYGAALSIYGFQVQGIEVNNVEDIDLK